MDTDLVDKIVSDIRESEEYNKLVESELKRMGALADYQDEKRVGHACFGLAVSIIAEFIHHAMMSTSDVSDMPYVVSYYDENERLV